MVKENLQMYEYTSLLCIQFKIFPCKSQLIFTLTISPLGIMCLVVAIGNIKLDIEYPQVANPLS